MRAFLVILVLTGLTINCEAGEHKTNSDSLRRNLSGIYMIRNYHIQNKDTFFYYYAGTSNACLQDESLQMIADTTYDFVFINEVKGFKYRFSEDSIALVYSEKGKRQYYTLSWYCQKGCMTFYMEGDTLYNLNPYVDTVYYDYKKHLNKLPRWIAYPINRLNRNEFEIQHVLPAFYPIVKPDGVGEVKTVFSGATRKVSSTSEVWIKN